MLRTCLFHNREGMCIGVDGFSATECVPVNALDVDAVFQFIDHNNTSLGTFDQRYWASWEFYKPGGPIILMTPGESNADGFTGYLTNRTVNGQIAQQEKGAAIMLEHRFFGLSNPYPDLSVASFKYHTIQRAIDDLEYLANNVVLPFPGGDKISPADAPWVL
ncbi:serine carboxypeptidase S28-domain-containing protein [Multifurca ochricompacta]|uniref:Serine carboxypeptidase S28-domain-containing protein n=1 Tax=Multifurca ochricompacta TaxID=376703 RepID=A0AAD4QG90_9AGAM|nr:serine carboxypeptidase S28-domain-containing protein [Multifurca ochricompacta]